MIILCKFCIFLRLSSFWFIWFIDPHLNFHRLIFHRTILHRTLRNIEIRHIIICHTPFHRRLFQSENFYNFLVVMRNFLVLTEKFFTQTIFCQPILLKILHQTNFRASKLFCQTRKYFVHQLLTQSILWRIIIHRNFSTNGKTILCCTINSIILGLLLLTHFAQIFVVSFIWRRIILRRIFWWRIVRWPLNILKTANKPIRNTHLAAWILTSYVIEILNWTTTTDFDTPCM